MRPGGKLPGLCYEGLPVRLAVFAAFTIVLNAQDLATRASQLRTLLRASPPLPLTVTDLRPRLPIDFVSSLAIDRQGTIYLFQRELSIDPIIAIDSAGRVLRSWGLGGKHKIPHSIRIDPRGDIWTVDAANSVVHKFNREGKLLLSIEVGLPANPRSAFSGATDIAFAGNRIFISDGYANARILEYSSGGKFVREWGKHGTGPGEFEIPHAIAIDRDNILYVADRENGRIQRFTLDGKFLSQWTHLGKTFSLKVAPTGELWLGTQPHDVANGVECWLVKVDRKTGKILGAIPSPGHHSIDLTAQGQPMTGARPNRVLLFR